MSKSCAAIALLCLSFPAIAGETPWQQVIPDVDMRLVSSDVRSDDGTSWIALEIAMPADTKTYWRLPGESGIPLSLDLAGSRGVAGHEIVWPYPLRETGNGYLEHVYYGHLVLPVALTLAPDASHIEAEVTLGVCTDVCVPVSTTFSHPLDFETPDTGHALRIRQALARTPIVWDEGEAPLGAVSFDAGTAALVVERRDPDFPVESLIADVDGQPWLFGSPSESVAGSTILVPLLGHRPAGDLSGHRVRLTFMTRDGPYELVREIGAR